MEITDKYRRYVLGLLFTIFTLNFLDRQLMSILSEPIKIEFGLSDTQLGILTGIAFAVFYTTLGFPMARWADRGNRVFIISASLAVWSFFTALTGLASGFWGLLLTRIGVGIGEAGCGPAAYSLIADYFSNERRGRAISFYMLGIPFGVFLGFLIGGIIAPNLGWRATFFFAGIPGIVLAFVSNRTIYPIPRGHSDNLVEQVSQENKTPILTSIRSILSAPSFIFMSAGTGSAACVSYGIGVFFASFLLRSHGLSLQKAGLILAVLYILGAGSGTLISGFLADRFGSKKLFWIPILSSLALIPTLLSVIFSGIGLLVFIAIFFANFFTGMYLSPTVVAVTRVIQVSERSFASAIFLFVTNIIGLGLGPLWVGWTSDRLKQWFMSSGMEATLANAEGLRYAFLGTMPFLVIAVACFSLAARFFQKDLKS